MTLATWIETAGQRPSGRARSSGDVVGCRRVIGTHPVQDNQRVSLELAVDDLFLGTLPAYWIENKGGNSFWHAPIPPQAVALGSIIRARIVERHDGVCAHGAYQDIDRATQFAGP